MSNKTIADLRGHLFDAIEGLKAGTLEIDRAKAINEVSQTIINTAKVEVEFVKVTSATTGSGFLPQIEAAPKNGDTVTPIQGGRVITHRMKG